MSKLVKYDWLWVGFWFYFAVVEGIALYHETSSNSDIWTLTHFITALLPMGVRAAFLAWLAWHFLVDHKKS